MRLKARAILAVGRGVLATGVPGSSATSSGGITGWRRGWPLFGRPDFVFPAARLAVFVDGCFWHGCPKHYTKPANNRAFWRRKLEANRARDRRVNRELKRLGWRILRIWKHDLRLPKPRCLARLKQLLAARFR